MRSNLKRLCPEDGTPLSFLYYANSRAIQPGEMTTPESPKLVREERDTAGDLTAGLHEVDWRDIPVDFRPISAAEDCGQKR
jgi:hypothetical protein